MKKNEISQKIRLDITLLDIFVRVGDEIYRPYLAVIFDESTSLIVGFKLGKSQDDLRSQWEEKMLENESLVGDDRTVQRNIRGGNMTTRTAQEIETAAATRLLRLRKRGRRSSRHRSNSFLSGQPWRQHLLSPHRSGKNPSPAARSQLRRNRL